MNNYWSFETTQNYINNKIITSSSQSSGIYSSIAISNDVTVAGTVELRNDNITIIKKILEILDKSSDLIEYVEDRPGHDFRYSMDSTKIRTELGWSESVKFEEGLEKTVEFYSNNPKWWERYLWMKELWEKN